MTQRYGLTAVGFLMIACSHDTAAPPSTPHSSGSAVSSASELESAAPVASGELCAPAGVTRLTVRATAVADPIRVSIIAPAGLDSSTPVVYLLHGANTDETQWEAIGAESALDDVVGAGSAPVALVLPDLPNTYAIDVDSAALRDDVVPFIEACLGGSRPAAKRGVGGISRGGELALRVAAANPTLFTVAGGHSPAINADEIAPLARSLTDNGTRVWLDVGTSDTLLASTRSLADELRADGARFEFSPAPGTHDRTYWGSRLRDYLHFYASALGSQGRGAGQLRDR
jgi:S-formylglutathione hydrolase FrmB